MSNGQNIFYNSKKSQKKIIYSHSEKNVKQINGNELENYMLSLYEYYINKIKKSKSYQINCVLYIHRIIFNMSPRPSHTTQFYLSVPKE